MKSKKKKILFIELFTFAGAPAGLITELEEILHHQEYEPLVICSRGSVIEPFVRTQSISSLILSEGNSISESKLQWIKAFLKSVLFTVRYRPNIIHINHYEWTGLGVLLAIIFKVPVVVHLKDVYSIQNKLNRFFFTIYQKTYYIAVSQHVKHLFIREYRLSSDRVQVIFDGISKEFSQERPRRSSQSTGKTTIVGTVSRIAPDRGVREFIETAYLVAKVFPQVKFSFAGIWEENFYTNFPEFAKLIYALKVEKNIEFRSRFANREALKGYYSSLGIFFIPAPQFALPNVAIEAMLMGKPVVAAQVGGVPEIVGNNQNGILVPYASAPLFAEALIKLLKDDTLRNQYGAKARVSAKRKFLSQDIYTQLLQLYTEALTAQ